MSFIVNVYLFDPNDSSTSHLYTQFLDGGSLSRFEVGKMFRVDKEEWAYKIIDCKIEPLNQAGDQPITLTVTD